MLKCKTCNSQVLLLDSRYTLSREKREMLGYIFGFPQVSQEAIDRHGGNVERLQDWFGPANDLNSRSKTLGVEDDGSISISAASPARLKQASQEELRKLMLLEGTFRLIETATDVTHKPQPMCEKCCASTLSIMKEQIDQIEDVGEQCRRAVEKLEYETEQLLLSSDEKSLDGAAEFTDAEITEFEKAEIEELEREETELLQELDGIWKERAEIALKIEQLNEEATELDEVEQQYWRSMRDYETMCMEMNEKQFRLMEQKTNAEQLLVDLHRMSALADVFRISYIGHVGTISGFSLAHAGDTIDWHEAYAALGQVLLLLDTVRKRHGLTLSHVLYPLGAFSKIKRAADGATFELYRAETKLGLGFMKQHPLFDQALVALLKVVNEIGQIARKTWETLPLYKIDIDEKDGTINGISVRYAVHNGKDELWTRAMKYLLANCKAILVWSTRSE